MIQPRPTPADGPRFIASDISESLDGLSFTVHDRQTGETAAEFNVPVHGSAQRDQPAAGDSRGGA
jgi:hypothetical protein